MSFHLVLLSSVLHILEPMILHNATAYISGYFTHNTEVRIAFVCLSFTITQCKCSTVRGHGRVFCVNRYKGDWGGNTVPLSRMRDHLQYPPSALPFFVSSLVKIPALLYQFCCFLFSAQWIICFVSSAFIVNLFLI